MSFFGFGATCDVKIEFKDHEHRKRVAVKNENGELEELYLFTGSDDVSGTVFVDIPKGKKIEHTGIKIELIGLIEYLYDRGNPYEFSTLSRELEGAGALDESKKYPFEFTNVEKKLRNIHRK